MKNTKNFIIVGAMLLFSALSTCGFAQKEEPGEPSPLPLQETMDQLRHQWDSLYVLRDPVGLADAYAEVAFITTPAKTILAKTREQISTSFKGEFASGNYQSYSTTQTTAVPASDGTIRVTGTYKYSVRGDSTVLMGNYDRNVILVNGKYKICKSNDQ